MTESKSPTAGDLALILFVVLLFAIAMGMCGCRSSAPIPCPECEQDIVEVDRPVPCIIVIAPLPDPDLPACRDFPGHDADENEVKSWALECGEVIERRDAVWRARDEAWAEKVAQHNRSRPRCTDVQ